MTDRRLRQLERRFRETGALEDEAAWLAARVQAGEVSPDRLALASDLKYAAARVAQNRRPADYVDLKLWPRELHSRWGTEVLVRVSLACARRVCEQIAHEPVRERLEEGLAAVAGWVACPCEEHVKGAKAAAVACKQSVIAGSLIVEAYTAIIQQPTFGGRFAPPGFDAPHLAADALHRRGLDGTAEVRRAVEREVVPWALGDRDPLADEVRA